MFLAQKKGIAGETLVIADHHVAGFQFSDKIRILSLPGLLDPPADAAVVVPVRYFCIEIDRKVISHKTVLLREIP